jgi:hypothetical protein
MEGNDQGYESEQKRTKNGLDFSVSFGHVMNCIIFEETPAILVTMIKNIFNFYPCSLVCGP